MVQFSDEELFDKWGVPFYLYTPQQVRPTIRDVYGSHFDIFPTLYNLSLSNTKFDALGVNMFDSSMKHYAFFSSELAASEEGGLRSLEKNKFTAFQWQNSKLVPSETQEFHKKLAIKYKSLAALTDFYFSQEKMSVKKEINNK